jgi:predicted O-methyltransferase YrrM
VKVTDYCPRAAPFDTYLKGRGLWGAEIGVDVGAHAEALLRHCPIDQLALVDPWPNPYCRGYCEGRLLSLGFRPRFQAYQCNSLDAVAKIPAPLDFIYIDQEHDGASVTSDLRAWWPKLKPGGVLGYRNYTATKNPLTQAIDAFVASVRCATHIETGEIVLVK